MSIVLRGWIVVVLAFAAGACRPDAEPPEPAEPLVPKAATGGDEEPEVVLEHDAEDQR